MTIWDQRNDEGFITDPNTSTTSNTESDQALASSDDVTADGTEINVEDPFRATNIVRRTNQVDWRPTGLYVNSSRPDRAALHRSLAVAEIYEELDDLNEEIVALVLAQNKEIVQNVSQIAGGAKQLFNTLFNMAQRVDDLIFATEKGSLNPVTTWGNQAPLQEKSRRSRPQSSVLRPQSLFRSRQARYSLARLYNPRPGLSGRSRKLGLHRGSAMTSSITGPLHALLLSLLDIKPVIWTVRDSPFHIKMPPEEEIGEVVNYVKLVTPSIKDKDHGKFSFYKPPLDRPIRVSHSLSGFQLTQKDLGNPLFIPLTIGEVFQEKGADCRFDVDIIVHVDSGENGGVILRTSPADSSNSWLQYVTFRLRNQDEAQLPPETELDANMIIEVPNEALPKFVEQLELESRLRRSPHWHDIKTLPLLDSVKVHFEDGAFSKYFTDANDESETHRVTDVELLHYIDALVDRHLSDQAAYRLRAVSHVYSLLRRFAVVPPSESPRCAKLFFDVPWAFGLAVKTGPTQILYQYTPRSDALFTIEGFPYILFEHRMLLQASCLVRLGNALVSDKSPTFFVKAFYINYDYHVDEYTLFQKGSDPIDDKVEYYKTSYSLTNEHHMFDFIFRIYNLLESIRALHARLSPQLSNILSSILTESEGFPYLMARRKRGTEDGASGSFKQRNQQSTGGPSSTTGTSVQTTVTVPNLNPSARTRLRIPNLLTAPPLLPVLPLLSIPPPTPLSPPELPPPLVLPPPESSTIAPDHHRPPFLSQNEFNARVEEDFAQGLPQG
ncbi:hypothetical protein H4582DRAFT_2052768 [Lactarius indigo]|nr:hypothetical protein H4582DRAFT_2052768 [Lactarius indigo]